MRCMRCLSLSPSLPPSSLLSYALNALSPPSPSLPLFFSLSHALYAQHMTQRGAPVVAYILKADVCIHLEVLCFVYALDVCQWKRKGYDT